MTAACHCTGGADIYYLSHFYLKSCLCQSSLLLLYCTTKHHNVVFMSIFHPPSDPSTGCCATVPLRLHVLLLGWLYCIWCCHIFFTVKPDCIITGLQYILRYIQEWSSFFTIWLLWIISAPLSLISFCHWWPRVDRQMICTKSVSLISLHIIIQEKEHVQFTWKRRCVIKLPGWWNKHFRGRFNKQICPNVILENKSLRCSIANIEQLHIWFIVWALSVKEKVEYNVWMDINYRSVQKFRVSHFYF